MQTIAMVHEGLSQTADEIVDFDKVISNLLKMSVDLATMCDQHIHIDYVSKFGMMPAQDATPLSLVLTELITNCVEHGFEGRKRGISPSPSGAAATASMSWWRMTGRGSPTRNTTVWHAPRAPDWARRSSTRSSPTISAAACAGSRVTKAAPGSSST